jgi:sporulation protein YlmC with PRC-barrel domain
MIAKYLATAWVGGALIAGGAAFAQTATAPAPGASTASPATQANLKGNWRASKLVGLAVYNESNEKLGDISELLLDNTGKINAVIVGIGGFLGVGQHDIAVSFDQLKWVNEPIRTASSDRAPAAPGMSSTTTTTSTTTTGAASGSAAPAPRDNWYPDHAVMSGTKDQLKAMPAFKYSDYK